MTAPTKRQFEKLEAAMLGRRELGELIKKKPRLRETIAAVQLRDSQRALGEHLRKRK